MYDKNLSADFRLRLSEKDMNFLKEQSTERGLSVSEVVRSIIGEYRRSLETMAILTKAMNMAQDQKEKETMSDGDTTTTINNQL